MKWKSFFKGLGQAALTGAINGALGSYLAPDTFNAGSGIENLAILTLGGALTGAANHISPQPGAKAGVFSVPKLKKVPSGK